MLINRYIILYIPPRGTEPCRRWGGLVRAEHRPEANRCQKGVVYHRRRPALAEVWRASVGVRSPHSHSSNIMQHNANSLGYLHPLSNDDSDISQWTTLSDQPPNAAPPPIPAQIANSNESVTRWLRTGRNGYSTVSAPETHNPLEHEHIESKEEWSDWDWLPVPLLVLKALPNPVAEPAAPPPAAPAPQANEPLAGPSAPRFFETEDFPAHFAALPDGDADDSSYESSESSSGPQRESSPELVAPAPTVPLNAPQPPSPLPWEEDLPQPLICQVVGCGELFARKCNLRRHEQQQHHMHGGPKMFNCPKCDRQFKYKQQCDNHVRRKGEQETN